jgi:hypothetical protein
VIGQPAPEEMSGLDDLIITHVIPYGVHNMQELARVGISEKAFYLLRPDGHIGLSGNYISISVIKEYLTQY